MSMKHEVDPATLEKAGEVITQLMEGWGAATREAAERTFALSLPRVVLSQSGHVAVLVSERALPALVIEHNSDGYLVRCTGGVLGRYENEDDAKAVLDALVEWIAESPIDADRVFEVGAVILEPATKD
jgi:hypothetical protein